MILSCTHWEYAGKGDLWKQNDLLSFADSTTGLEHAFHLTVTLRSHGFTTRLETTTFNGFVLHTVIATPPTRLTSADRGCNL